MKYTDRQRIERIVATTRKLLDYLEVQGITKEDILNQEPLRWTITTAVQHRGTCLSPDRRIQGSPREYTLGENFGPAASPGA